MRVHLAAHPWAPRADHVVEAGTERQWRAAIVSLTGRYRYSAAVEIPDLDPTGKPYPVQWFSDRDPPGPVISQDGFLVVRVGLESAHLAAAQWAVLTEFPRQRRAAERFLDRLGEFTRRAVYPPPRPVPDSPPPPDGSGGR